MKKLLVLLLALVMVLSMVACGEQPPVDEPADEPTEAESSETTEVEVEPVEDEGKVLNIYCWNTEFQDRFVKYFEEAGLVPEGVTVNWVITPNENNAYQNKLDEALLAQDGAADDDKVDLFLIEADYALKYVNTDYTLDVINEVGLTDADVANMYQYTKDICTVDGVLKGVSWQATPAGVIYRRSIAEEVIGSSDPADVQAAIDTWEKFDAVAADAKELGYYMVSGYDDDFRVFSNNVSQPWVTDGKITIDPSVEYWVDQTKLYTDMGYNNKASLWSAESWAGAKEDGKVMCYFGPGWFFDFCLMPATLADAEGDREVGNGSYGDWGLVKGPQGFFWGGTWICAAAGTDNVNLVKDIMYTLTCDTDTLVSITDEMGDFTNNVPAMEALAADASYGHEFLGGQNHIAVLLDSAQSISMANIGPYDQGMTEEYQKAFKDYFDGIVDKDTALENFYTAILEKYPNLTR